MGFKDLYEMFAFPDVRYECFYKMLYEVGDIVWELVGGTVTCWYYWLDGGIGDFGKAIKNGVCAGFDGILMVSGVIVYSVDAIKEIKSGQNIISNSLYWIWVKLSVCGGINLVDIEGASMRHRLRTLMTKMNDIVVTCLL